MAEPYLIEEPAPTAAVSEPTSFGHVSPSIMEAVDEAARAASAAEIEANGTDGSGGGPGGGGAGGGGTLTLPAAAMKFADLTESGSESGDGEPDAEPGTSAAARSSPPPNCAICLSRCRRKCFTDSCMHQFCFKCLCEWSKVKPECPLCKQPFKTIIHNVRTLDDYDRYPVQSSTPPVAEHSSLRFHIVNIRRPRFMPLLQNQSVMTNDVDGGAGIIGAGDGDDADGMRVNPSLNRFEPYRMELMNFYRNDQDALATSSSLSQLWRRYVYDRKLYALPVRDNLTGQFREWTARFYRNNPAQMHRLMPWIHRDLVCLLRNVSHTPSHVSAVMHVLHQLLTMNNILGALFRIRLTPYLGERTAHFIHELFNFARSPFDMIGYDRVVQYSARVAEEVEIDLLDMGSPESSNESDVHLDLVGDGEVAGLPNIAETDTSDYGTGNSHNRTTPARPSTSVIVTNPSATHSFSVTMASDGSELPGISIRRTTTSTVGSQTVAINLSMRRPTATTATSNDNDDEEVIEIDDGDAAANAEVAAINDGSSSRRHAGASLPVSAHIELQSSDSSNSSSSTSDDDECVFVLERKPPHLRTPELVSLDSNSDSDVVFVDEQKAANSSGAANATNPSATTNSVNVDDLEEEAAHAASELFMGPSTSSGVCSGTGKNWRKVLEMARREDELRGKARRKRASRRNPNVTSSSSSSDSVSSSSSSNYSSTSSEDDSESDKEAARRKQRMERKRNARKRAAKEKISNTPRKRSKRQGPPQTEEQEQEEEEQPLMDQKENTSSSSSSSSDNSDSTEGSGKKNTNINNTSTCDDDDDDVDDNSSENLQLSALRATLKAEAALEDRKPLKLELPAKYLQSAGEQPVVEQGDENTQPDLATLQSKRRRRSGSSSNLSNHSASLASNTTTATSSTATGSAPSPFKWLVASEVSDPLMRGLATPTEVRDIANSLIELSTLTHQRSEPSLFNDRSDGGEVDDAINFLGNTLPSSNTNTLEEEAHLGIYSDAETSQQFPLDVTIDVVGESDVHADVEAEADGEVEAEDDGEAEEADTDDEDDEEEEELELAESVD
ncbi:E3 ubiquitin-protein ligase Topors isoform X2 [Drosophila willistoni]|uniref:E3 ubiquitin-protein ligase Topors isoform X2 n=1 Tax=Drosophila willistoni TaxID=7260 RepID=UPI001F07F954|nr:E3 ubiquitin-protein ligase Topors isoform X2 [Drosophila willistoni]